MILGCLLWTGAYGLDFVFIDHDWHKIFISLVHLGVGITCSASILIGIEFTQNRHLLKKRIWPLIFIQPFAILILVILDPLYHTLLSDTYIATIQDRIQWVQVLSVYTNFIELGGSAVWFVIFLTLVSKSIRSATPRFKNQFYLLLVPYLLIWIVALSHSIGFRPLPGLNLTTLGLSFSAAWFFFTIIFHRMHDLVPLVRSEIVDELDEPVIILDARDRVADWNIAAEQLFVDGRRYLNLTTADDFFKSFPDISNKIRNLPEKRTHTEWSFESREPRKCWAIHAKRVKDQNRNNIGLVLVFRDVTEQRNLEMKMKQANETLQIANATKDRFLSIISHDLRGPLVGIKNLLRILNEKFATQNKEASEMTQALVEATDSIFSLLENLLEWSKLQRGQEEFSPKLYLLDSLVREAVQIFSLNADHKKIQILCEIPTHAFVYCDDRMIFAVIRNLLSNAIKFSHLGGLIQVRAVDQGKEWLLTVRDEGVGLSALTLSKLFLPGEVVKSFGTQGETGNGVGLLLCREFALRNGGSIFAESDGSSGSVFSVILPKHPVVT
jgi:signal transduction histidine kinase